MKSGRPMNISEAAEILGVHADTIRNWEKKGLINCTKTPGNHRRYNLKDLEDFMNGEKDVTIEELNILAGNTEITKEFLRSQAQEIVDRWEKTNLLKDLPMPTKLAIAVMLENQRIANEASTIDDVQFKRISIPLIRRMFGRSFLFDVASVQPMLGPTSLIYYLKEGRTECEAIAALENKMKVSWSFEAAQDLRSVNNISAEQELTAIMAQEIILEIERKMITMMCEAAAFKKSLNYNELRLTERDVPKLLLNFINETESLYNRPPTNWIITSPEMTNTLASKLPYFEPSSPSDTFSSCLGVNLFGKFTINGKEISIYKDPLFPVGKILTGYRGTDPIDAGLIFAPYVMLNQTPTVLDPDSFCPRKGIFYRGAEKVVNPTYFSVLALNNITL